MLPTKEETAAPASRILIAEDNPTNQLIVRKTLEKQGYIVDVVVDGRAAVAAVNSGCYKLVIMDCHMPEMDGYEATEVIRRSDNPIPIIALTASPEAMVRERSRKAGMNDYLTKPFRSADLLGKIEHWLKPRWPDCSTGT